MSTRANVIITDEYTTLFFYRHSDGYPEVTGESLKEFIQGYSKHMRLDVMQSAGWLILKGHEEYKGDGYGWKVGAYEPTDKLHGDAEYVYIIDLVGKTLTCRSTANGFWDDPKLKNTKAVKGFAFPIGSAP